MPNEVMVDVAGVAAYRWSCQECGAQDIAASETEAAAHGRRHVAWSHPVPTALQRAAQREAAQPAS